MPQAKRTSPTDLTGRVVANMTRLRKARNWTQSELTRQMGACGWKVNTTLAIGRLETGKRCLTVDELAILGAVFDLPPWDLTKTPQCARCADSPPPGFTCNECGTTTEEN